MYAKHSVGVIIPWFKNQEFLKATCTSIPPYIDRIFIVNGYSQSESGCAIPDPRVLVIWNGNSSVEGNLKEAYQKAIEERLDITIVVEPDQTINQLFLSQLLDPLVWGEAEYAIGKQLPVVIKNGGDLSNKSVTCYSNYIQILKRVDSNPFKQDLFPGYSAFSLPYLQHMADYVSMVGHQRICAVIPCYNEGLTIGSLILRARKYVDEVMVINDGSKDDTAKVAEQAGAKVISHQWNKGKAAAVETGLQYARSNNFDITILLDGDGQHNPADIPTVIFPLLKKEADLIIGSRFLEKKSEIPIHRILGQKILTLFTNVLSGQQVTDSQSGFRAMNKRAAEALSVHSEGYSVETDMISCLSKAGVRIAEVPIDVKYDVPFKHKKNPFSHGYDILAKIIGELGYARPLLLFGISGFLFLIFGVFLGSWAFTTYYTTSKLPFGPSIGSAIFLVLGMLLWIAGLILNSLSVIMKTRT